MFTAEFKREQIDRLLRGEVTVAELSRDLGVSRPLIQRRKHLATRGAEAAVGYNSEVVRLSEPWSAQARIKELERLVGKRVFDVRLAAAVAS